MAKQILFDEQARRALERGVNAVADAVKGLLDRASFAGATLDSGGAMKLIDRSRTLIDQIRALASDGVPP